MKYDTIKLAAAIKKANEAAQIHATEDDGGTCNFDSCYIPAPGIRGTQVREIEAVSGVPLSLMSSGYCGRRIELGGTLGQGNRRTKMAEEQRRSLEADGIKAGMFYMMD